MRLQTVQQQPAACTAFSLTILPRLSWQHHRHWSSPFAVHVQNYNSPHGGRNNPLAGWRGSRSGCVARQIERPEPCYDTRLQDGAHGTLQCPRRPLLASCFCGSRSSAAHTLWYFWHSIKWIHSKGLLCFYGNTWSPDCKWPVCPKLL